MPCENHPEVEEGLDACYGCGLPFCPNCLITLGGLKFCASCKTEHLRDMQSGVAQGHELNLAGFGSRILAWIIDYAIRVAVILPPMIAFGFFSIPDPDAAVPAYPFTAGFWLFQLLAMAFPLVYEALMLQWRGQTVGKIVCRIKVVTPTGGNLTAGQSWIRSLIRMLVEGFCFIDDIIAFFNPERTALHDMAARTRVIKL